MLLLDFILKPQLTAGPKAREDIYRTLSQRGYTRQQLVISREAKLQSIWSLLMAIFTLPWRTQTIIQYPLGTPRVTRWILNILHLKRNHVCILIHDIESLRQNQIVSPLEIGNFNLSDHLIVHTAPMKSLLQPSLPSTPISVLTLFDYQTVGDGSFLFDASRQTKKNRPQLFDDTCIFAGNLQKSVFLRQLKELPVSFRLYGTEGHLEDILSETVTYGGKFQPDDPSILTGKWGLVWDGDTIDTCSGPLGNYLKYNAPHKLSLYLAVGIPVIVWSESALATFVEQQGIGLAIPSLQHLKEKIDAISDTEYAQMKTQVAAIAQKLTTGQQILQAIPPSFLC